MLFQANQCSILSLYKHTFHDYNLFPLYSYTFQCFVGGLFQLYMYTHSMHYGICENIMYNSMYQQLDVQFLSTPDFNYCEMIIIYSWDGILYTLLYFFFLTTSMCICTLYVATIPTSERSSYTSACAKQNRLILGGTRVLTGDSSLHSGQVTYDIVR